MPGHDQGLPDYRSACAHSALGMPGKQDREAKQIVRARDWIQGIPDTTRS